MMPTMADWDPAWRWTAEIALIGCAESGTPNPLAPPASRAACRNAACLRQNRVLYGVWVADANRGNFKGALEHAQQFLSLAEMQSASAPRLIGHRLLGTGLLWTGNFRQARPHLELAASLYRPEEHREFAFRYGQDIGASAMCFLSWALWHDGYPDQAARTADRALLHAREFGHAYTLAYTLWHDAILAVHSRDVRRVERLANENATISGERGFPLYCAHCEVLLGWVAAHLGQGAHCVDRMRRGIAANKGSRIASSLSRRDFGTSSGRYRRRVQVVLPKKVARGRASALRACTALDRIPKHGRSLRERPDFSTQPSATG
jgi:hypothetical protein